MARAKKQASERRALWRWLGVCSGLIVFLAHVVTYRPPEELLGNVPPEIKELIYHSLLLGSFALVYRLSFKRGGWRGALLSILVCSGWGAACELSQQLIDGRSYAWQELLANIAAPIAVISLYSLFSRR